MRTAAGLAALMLLLAATEGGAQPQFAPAPAPMPNLVPAPSPRTLDETAPAVSHPSGLPAYDSAYWLKTAPLAPYLDGLDLPQGSLVHNITTRYVGEDVNDSVKMESMWDLMRQNLQEFVKSLNCSFTFVVRKDPGARVIWANASAMPQPALSPGGVHRGTKQLSRYASVVSEMQIMGGPYSRVVQQTSGSPMGDYLETVLQAHSINVQLIGCNETVPASLLPVMSRIPSFTPTYVLGTVIQVNGSGFLPISLEIQSLLLLALKEVCSTPVGLSGRFQSVYSDGQVTRYGLLSYTSRPVTDLGQLGGGMFPHVVSEKAALAGINISAGIIASFPLGTQQDELQGHPNFRQQIAALPISPQVLNDTLTGEPRPPANPTGISLTGKLAIMATAIIAGIAAIGLIFWAATVTLHYHSLSAKSSTASSLPEYMPSERLSVAAATPAKIFRRSHTTAAVTSPCIVGSSECNSASSLLRRGSGVDGSGRGAPWAIPPSQLTICQRLNGEDWLLGGGSTGRVYRGKRGGVQDVAIKVINSGTVRLQAFNKELDMLRLLNLDKNLVQFYGACTAGDSIMLVTELMDGGNLADAIAEDATGQLRWHGRGASVLLDVIRGLCFLHSNNVVHRDLASKNILLTAAGEAKLSDIGMARVLTADVLPTRHGSDRSCAYKAPEVLSGCRYDRTADIYSFGIVALEVITHTPPRVGRDTLDWTSLDAGPEVVDLLKWCLEPEPHRRPTAFEVFQVLHELACRPQDVEVRRTSRENP